MFIVVSAAAADGARAAAGWWPGAASREREELERVGSRGKQSLIMISMSGQADDGDHA